MPDWRSQITEFARTLGFDRVGVADASVPLEQDFARYEAFVKAGKHGTMAYLAEHPTVRRQVNRPEILEGATSVICVAQRYGGHETGVSGTESLVARYARGRDYHNHLRRRLRKLSAFVEGLLPGVRARALVDTAPVLERAWAARAGLGFIGKNGLLIVMGEGSFVLLGEVVTTLELAPDAPLAERCGSCSACLDACPTSAFDAPFMLDPRRCIAYLTIEHRGAMPEALRDRVGEHLFGCDVCQDACPYNGPVRAPFLPEYAPLPVWAEHTVESLLSMGDEEFLAGFSGSPARRARREGLLRNALTVLGGRHSPELRAVFERLVADPDPSIREHARWALERLDTGL